MKKNDEDDCAKLRDLLSPGQDDGVGVDEALEKYLIPHGVSRQRAQG